MLGILSERGISDDMIWQVKKIISAAIRGKVAANPVRDAIPDRFALLTASGRRSLPRLAGLYRIVKMSPEF
jgi:hypothetical protein